MTQADRVTMALDDSSPTTAVPVLWEYPEMRCQCPTQGYCTECRAHDKQRPGITMLGRKERSHQRGRPRSRKEITP